MPIYEYVCGACGKKTEVIQRMNQAPLKICPHCGGNKLKKAFSVPAIQFKGSGFYITDYARAQKESGEKGGAEKSESAGEKLDKADKVEKAEKADKAEKAEKADKAEKTEKKDKPPKAEKPEKKKEKKAD